MTSVTRQNTIFVAEDWLRVYEALENINFRDYDFEGLVTGITDYIRTRYPDEFNDFIASSEFMMKVEILAWLALNVSFRVDLAARENFIDTAERKESLIRLARNVGYKVNRVRPATGFLKIISIRTDQTIIDLDGNNLANKTIIWNDTRDDYWFEKFRLVIDNAFSNRTPYGNPADRHAEGNLVVETYEFASSVPSSGSYRITINVDGDRIPIDIHAGRMDDQGNMIEPAPLAGTPMRAFFRSNGSGFQQPENGFFLPFRQGTLKSTEVVINDPVPFFTITLPDTSIANDDVWVVEIDNTGNPIAEWVNVDSVFGEGVSYNTNQTRKIFEIETLRDDGVRLVFGDGSYGDIPQGRFVIWYRVSNARPPILRPSRFPPQTITIPYTKDGSEYRLVVTLGLVDTVSNGVVSETRQDLRQRIGRFFYTQNRMVTADDYNNFFLKDNTIRKVKAVNRQYIGHSRFNRLTDPTSLYENVSHVASDGRIYNDEVRTRYRIPYYSMRIQSRDIINNHIIPRIQSEDKVRLYQGNYAPFATPYSIHWRNTSVINGTSRGNLVDSGGTPVLIGSFGSGNLKYFLEGSIIAFQPNDSVSTIISRVIEDGTAVDGIFLRNYIPDGMTVAHVLPPMRTIFTTQERSELGRRLENGISFALSYDHINDQWLFIDETNIDRTSAFSLANQGDTSNSGKDASWMLAAFHDPASLSWEIVDRGFSTVFESAREVDFVVLTDGIVKDMRENRLVADHIVIMGCNESKNSPSRLGYEASSDCNITVTNFLGDGTETRFKTNITPIDPNRVIIRVDGVLMDYLTDFTIINDPSGDYIVFTTPPQPGSFIDIQYDGYLTRASFLVKENSLTTNDRTYDLTTSNIDTFDTFSFIDGIYQLPNYSYTTYYDGSKTSLALTNYVDAPANCITYVFEGLTNGVYHASPAIGDGTTVSFPIPTKIDDKDKILVFVDGVEQTENHWSYSDTLTGGLVTFVTPPASGSVVSIRFPIEPNNVLVSRYIYTGDGSTDRFSVSGSNVVGNGINMMVFVNGVLQNGAWATNEQSWFYDSVNGDIVFITPPENESEIDIIVFDMIVGRSSTAVPFTVTSDSETAISDVETPSCSTWYLGRDVYLRPYDIVRHEDGYTNPNGVLVEPMDTNLDGLPEMPFFFRDFVRSDGRDYVLWRKVSIRGFDAWDPIDETTSPKGTYGYSSIGDIKAGDPVDLTRSDYGDIHYDVSTDQWLVADRSSGTWVIDDPTKYRKKIGRSGIKFIWRHYSPESHRIDPSHSNIINVHIITDGYYRAMKQWVIDGADPANRPVPETPDVLEQIYSTFEKHKMMGDSIIYYPGAFKLLFGDAAPVELRAKFKVIKSPNSSLSDQDLILRIISLIDDYFDIDKWDFGEVLYFTELAAYLHTKLAPDLQSVVIVPVEDGQTFGRLFQVRAEPTELFMSCAQPKDVEIVSSFNDRDLRIGVSG